MWVLDILVLGTPGPWNPWTLGLLDLFPPPTLPHISPYILLPPPISSYYSPPLVWFGLVWFILMLKRYYILLHSLPLTSSHLLPIPPSYPTLLPNLLLTPPTSSRGISDDYWVHTWRDFNVILLRKVSWVVVETLQL